MFDDRGQTGRRGDGETTGRRGDDGETTGRRGDRRVSENAKEQEYHAHGRVSSI